MDQVLVGVQVGGDLLELDQLIDVAVESLELLDVHLAVLHIVRHGLIDRNQVFKVDAQDGDLEARAPVVRLPVVVVIPAGGQEVCHLVQNLRREEPSAGYDMESTAVGWLLLGVGVVYLSDLAVHV